MFCLRESCHHPTWAHFLHKGYKQSLVLKQVFRWHIQNLAIMLPLAHLLSKLITHLKSEVLTLWKLLLSSYTWVPGISGRSETIQVNKAKDVAFLEPRSAHGLGATLVVWCWINVQPSCCTDRRAPLHIGRCDFLPWAEHWLYVSIFWALKLSFIAEKKCWLSARLVGWVY